MKKLLAIVPALALCLGMVTMATAETTKYKIGVLVPAVTHGWVGGITYNAEQYCKELEAAGTIEYKLLTVLARNVGKVLTHSYIMERVCGRGGEWENNIASLRVFMATLRKKLEPTPDGPQFIQTHVGVGYRMLRVE